SDLFAGFEAVLQQYTAVEDQVVGVAVTVVEAEVADTHELEGGCGLDGAVLTQCVKGLGLFDHGGFDLAALQYGQRFGIQVIHEVLFAVVGVSVSEQIALSLHLLLLVLQELYGITKSATESGMSSEEEE
ncbi:MAG: hypothetical protein IIX39_05515, partial [Clostridia bacterium]|nr:hypothetical protein [Clostridia bacterium]